MGTMKTSDLTGVALDWAAAKCEGFKECIVFGRGTVKDKGFAMPNKHGQNIPMLLLNTYSKWVMECEGHPWAFDQTIWRPSTSWQQAGPIIEREKIAVFSGREEKEWVACISGKENWIDTSIYEHDISDTPLIAAMRCYVASKLSDEVKIPEELL